MDFEFDALDDVDLVGDDDDVEGKRDRTRVDGERELVCDEGLFGGEEEVAEEVAEGLTVPCHEPFCHCMVLPVILLLLSLAAAIADS